MGPAISTPVGEVTEPHVPVDPENPTTFVDDVGPVHSGALDSTSDPQTTSPAGVRSESPHQPAPSSPARSPSPIVEDTQQPRTKRRAEGWDSSTERGSKRGRHEGVLGPTQVKKGTLQRKHRGRVPLTKHTKKDFRRIKEEATRRFAEFAKKDTQRKDLAAQRSSQLRDGSQISQGRSETPQVVVERTEEKEIEKNEGAEGRKDDPEMRHEAEEPLTDDSSVVYVSTRAAVGGVSDEEESFKTMRVHNKADLEDLKLSLRSPLDLDPRRPPSLTRDGGAKKQFAGERQKVSGKQKVAAQRQMRKSRAQQPRNDDETKDAGRAGRPSKEEEDPINSDKPGSKSVRKKRTFDFSLSSLTLNTNHEHR